MILVEIIFKSYKCFKKKDDNWQHGLCVSRARQIFLQLYQAAYPPSALLAPTQPPAVLVLALAQDGDAGSSIEHSFTPTFTRSFAQATASNTR